MEHITIAISTRNRLGKLIRCLNSIPVRDDVRVILACDADHHTAMAMMHPFNLAEDMPGPTRPVDMVIYSRNHVGSIALHNLMSPLAQDGLLTLMDDMELFPFTLDVALEAFNDAFPDDYGVLGLNQVNLPHFSPAGCALVGQTFLDGLPGRKVYNPDYWHFADGELYRWAEAQGKFLLASDAVVKHHHPGVFKGEADQTHADARMRKEEDLTLSAERTRLGLMWGKPA